MSKNLDRRVVPLNPHAEPNPHTGKETPAGIVFDALEGMGERAGATLSDAIATTAFFTQMARRDWVRASTGADGWPPVPVRAEQIAAEVARLDKLYGELCQKFARVLEPEFGTTMSRLEEKLKTAAGDPGRLRALAAEAEEALSDMPCLANLNLPENDPAFWALFGKITGALALQEEINTAMDRASDPPA